MTLAKFGFPTTRWPTFLSLMFRGRQRSERKSGEGNEPGNEDASMNWCGHRWRTVLIKKLMASGTKRFDKCSNCKHSVHRNRPLAMSVNDLTRPSPKYAPISNRAGEITAWFMSLVGHTMPIMRNRVSSAGPGQVLASASRAPIESPRLRFLCIRAIFSTKHSADCIGYDFVRAKRWGRKDDKRPKRGDGGDVMYRI